MSPASLAAYLALPSDQQRMIALFVVVHEPLNRTAMAGWLKQAEIYNAKRQAYSTMALSPLVDRWIAAGLLRLVSDTYGECFQAPATFTRGLLAKLQADGELMPIVKVVRQHAPIRGHYSFTADPGLLCRELVLSAQLGLSQELRQSLESYRPRPDQSRGTLFVQAFGLAASSEGLKRLGLPYAEAYLSLAFELACEQLAPVDEELLTFVHEAGALIASSVVAQAAWYLTLRGERERAIALLADRSDASCAAASCLLALADQRLVAAREHAEHALTLTRTKKSGKLKGLDGPLAKWLTLVLFTDTTNPRARLLAREQLEIIGKKDRTRGLIVEALSSLDRVLGGQLAKPQPWAQSYVQFARGWSELLVWTLVLRFTDVGLPLQLPELVAAERARAEANGFAWLAEELERAADTTQARGLARLYVPEEPWERALRSLDAAIEHASSNEPSSEVAAEQRLVWTLIVESDGSHQLTARVQTRTQSGFTSGRQITWKKLAESGSAPFMSSEDRRVLQHLRVVRDHGYRGSEAHQLGEGAPLALVDHPRVFADHECRARVEVVRGDVRLDVQDRAQSIRLMIEPAGCLTREVLCQRDGLDRVVVYALTSAQRLIAQELSASGLSVPEQARERVTAVLGKLARHVPLASELAFEAGPIEEVEVDARIQLRLRRTSTGLSLRACVVPIGAAPSFVPGQGSATVLTTQRVDERVRTVRGVRDLQDERERLERIFAACPTLQEIVPAGDEYRVEQLTSCLELLCELRALGDEIVIAWPDGKAFAVVGERGMRDLRLRVQDEGAWLLAEGELDVDEELKLSFRQLLAQKGARNGRFVTLDDGRFVALSHELLRALESADVLSRVRGGRVELHPLALFGAASLADARLDTDAGAAARLSRAREAARLTPEVPKLFEATLRGYQQVGYAWLSRLAHWGAGGCLADDMGLGKTLQALALLVEHAPGGPSLVVAPTSVCSNWLDEARKFAPSLRVTGFGTGERERTLTELGPFDVLVCSYGVLQQEAALLAQKRFRVVVLDEAQAIKNASTLRARAASELVGEVRVALTGTPIENHLGELWSILNFLNPGLLGSAKAFEERFVKPIQRQGDRASAQLLKRIVQPFVLRRRKSEVLDDLPEKTVITLRVQPSLEERALFAALREQAIARASQHENQAQVRIHLLAELMRLRRAACHPDLVAPEAGLTSSKLSVLETLLLELREGGHRALVFSQFVDYLSIVRRRLEAIGFSYQYLDGSSSPAARATAVRSFQAGESDAFLISLKAGGFGLNLTAADYVVHLDPWWNPAVEDQASDRAHRIGQTRPVTIYRLVMEGSVEEKILGLHAQKRDLADDLLEGASAARSVDVDDLMALLEEAQAVPHDGALLPGEQSAASLE
jgi:hypothetical protein